MSSPEQIAMDAQRLSMTRTVRVPRRTVASYAGADPGRSPARIGTLLLPRPVAGWTSTEDSGGSP